MTISLKSQHVNVMHIGAVLLNFLQTGEILVSKIRDLYREDMQPVMDLTKGA